MKNLFNFEAEPFEFDSEFEEYEEEQPTKPCRCHQQSSASEELSEEYTEEQADADSEFSEEYESDFETEPSETYPDFEETGELVEEYEDYEDYENFPTAPPRTPQPGTGTIPAGPFRVQIPCRAGQDDLADLSLSLSLLNTARQRFPRRIRGARIGVLAVINRMIRRAASGGYAQRGCTGRNLRRLAARVRGLRWPQGMMQIRNRLINSIQNAARRATARRAPARRTP